MLISGSDASSNENFHSNNRGSSGGDSGGGGEGTISRKITFSSIGFLFYAYGDRVGLEALRSVFTSSRPYIT